MTKEPRWLAESDLVRMALEENLPKMTTILERQRRKPTSTQESIRAGSTLSGSVQVQLWTEADGSERVLVLGDSAMSRLELKGLLHDGIYALAHTDEPGFITDQA